MAVRRKKAKDHELEGKGKAHFEVDSFLPTSTHFQRPKMDIFAAQSSHEPTIAPTTMETQPGEEKASAEVSSFFPPSAA